MLPGEADSGPALLVFPSLGQTGSGPSLLSGPGPAQTKIGDFVGPRSAQPFLG